MATSLITVRIENRIATITLNRPEKRNALSAELVTELKYAIRELEADPDVKVMILTGAGKAFCAGADLAYLQSLQNNSFEENLADSRYLKALFELIYLSSKVIIAKVQGHAIAGGAGLASVCDVVFAVPEARLGYTEVKIGFIPAIVSLFLVRKIGESAARELLLSGRLIDAGEARQLGMVNFVVDAENLDDAVSEYAGQLVDGASADSLRLTKKLLQQVQDHPTGEALDIAAHMNAEARATEDCRKGIAAFLNKQNLTW